MYQLLVELQVRNFDSLQQFEITAARIMSDYGGEITTALETEHHPDGSGIEIHIVSFPDRNSFLRYQQDNRLEGLAELRKRAITATTVREVLSSKDYSNLSLVKNAPQDQP